MEAEVFINFVKMAFLAQIGTERPVFVICVGHKTHISLRLLEIALEENVTILIMPPHSSHILQTFHLSCDEIIKTTTFCRGLDPNIKKYGFIKVGIYPFNGDIIPEERFNMQCLQ
ncbi:hypothetical protein PR048_012572 [Dryococelus australis]|uniref:DDE-1 domain-containing protein n=1 Tax=Dryococelus australis TaxID=614101 RepID=A0ABQ9HPX1_9NEOP|nr:hypothetical protein PR048_012572 [Dryococelus australis]